MPGQMLEVSFTKAQPVNKDATIAKNIRRIEVSRIS
jgi:hypothetical protein